MAYSMTVTPEPQTVWRCGLQYTTVTPEPHRLCGGVAYRIRLSHPNHTDCVEVWPTV